MSLTEIQQFYKDKTIFITGGTGFVGKLLVEKLLRSCPAVKKIILPIRPKRNETIEKRISEYFKDTLFDLLRTENPSIMNKIDFMKADLDKKNFGFNFEETEVIRTTVNIIFHSAAVVKLKLSLSEAVNNVKITKNTIEMARKIKDLEAFIYVSTAYSHSVLYYAEEKVCNLSYKPDFLFNLVDNLNETTLSNITPILLNKWENTYLMTKNVSECLVAEENDNFPIAIFRPVAVTPTYREPISGWVNTFQATNLFAIGLTRGSIKVLFMDKNYGMQAVPADFVVNCMISIAWNTARNNRTKELKVYNYCPETNPCSKEMLCDGFINTKYPLECVIWKPGCTMTNSKWLFNIYFLLYQTIPSIVGDIILIALKKKPIFRKNAKKIIQLTETSSYFLLNNFKFEYKNVVTLWNTLSPEDKILFNFDLNSVDWNEYVDVWAKGSKILLKEDFNNIKSCEAKLLKLRVAHYGLLTTLFILGLLIFFFFILG